MCLYPYTGNVNLTRVSIIAVKKLRSSAWLADTLCTFFVGKSDTLFVGENLERFLVYGDTEKKICVSKKFTMK
jgi:hypothetical protein